MKTWTLFGVGVLAVSIAAPVVARAVADPLAKPIRIGLSGPDLDACPAVGRVTGTNPRGDHFLSVRRGPSVKATVRARLKPDASLIVCDATPDRKWLGVIYTDIDVLGGGDVDSPAGGDVDCGISSPIQRPRAYTGPCKSGWVSARFVEIIAG
jgi:hypothetical protein